MACDVNMGRMNMAVFSDEVLSEDRTEQLRRVNRGMFGNNVACILDCVRGDKYTVVFLGIPKWSKVSQSVWW